MPQRAVRSGLAFLLLAVASLGIKAASVDFAVGLDHERFLADLAATLRAQGFAVRVQRFRYLEAAVVATRGDCALQARDGSQADLTRAYRHLAGPLGPPRFAYQGRVGEVLPAVRLEARDYLQRTLARLGIATARPAPVALFASAGCDLGAIDLSAVTLHPGGGPR